MTNTKRHPLIRAIVAVALLVTAVFLAIAVGDANYHATATGWIPLVTLLMLILLSWCYVCVLKRCISLGTLQNLCDCARGEEIPISVSVHNRSILPVFGLEVLFAVSDSAGNAAESTTSTLTLAPREFSQIGFATKFEHVGRFSVGVKQVIVQDFLGLFYRKMDISGTCEVCVTPNLVSLAQLRFESQSAEDVPRPQKAVLADSMDYAYVRPYVVGDPLKTIHWKLSARSEYLQTRLYEQTVNPGVAIMLDFSVPEMASESTHQLIDCVVESGLSVAKYAQSQGVELEIHYVDKAGGHCVLNRWDTDMALRFVESMPEDFCSEEASARSASLVQEICGSGSRQPNVVVCSANLSDALLSEVIQAKMARRTPLFIAAVPSLLVDRAREHYLAPVNQLSAAGIASKAVSHAEELAGAVL